MNEKRINLVGNYKPKYTKEGLRSFKGKNARIFMGKMTISAVLSYFTLMILKDNGRAMYGIEILSDITNTFQSKEWKPSHGTLYPLLEKMEDKGLLDNYQEGQSQNSKRFWMITKHGLEEFQTLQSEFHDKIEDQTEVWVRIRNRSKMSLPTSK